MNTDLSVLLTNLLDAMHANADFLRQARRGFSAQNIEYKGTNNLVSFVDRESERRLTAACAELLPGSGFIREESGDLHPDRTHRWIIDPLDGTTNFIHDVPAWCMSVALQENEETVLGVVYDVPRREVFTAVRGGGAYVNGEPMRVSGGGQLGSALLGTGFPYTSFDRFDDYLAVLQNLLRNSQGVRRFGAAAIDLAWVAMGRLDGFFEMGLQAWDVAAGELIIREAGGTVSDFHGTDNYIFGRQIVAATPKVHDQMLHVFRERF